MGFSQRIWKVLRCSCEWERNMRVNGHVTMGEYIHQRKPVWRDPQSPWREISKARFHEGDSLHLTVCCLFVYVAV